MWVSKRGPLLGVIPSTLTILTIKSYGVRWGEPLVATTPLLGRKPNLILEARRMGGFEIGSGGSMKLNGGLGPAVGTAAGEYQYIEE